MGVDVFFVISGFVVCASLAASERTRLSGFVAEFYARRLARIIPALVVMLAVASVVSTLFVPKAWVSRLNDQTARYAYFGLSNVLLMTDTNRDVAASRAELNPYAHTWSLGVEEQFYLLFPLACFFWVRATSAAHHRGRLAMVALLGSAAGLSFAGSRWATEAHPIAAFYSIAFRFWELAAGALLFQLTASRPAAVAENSPAWRRPWPWVGLLDGGCRVVPCRSSTLSVSVGSCRRRWNLAHDRWRERAGPRCSTSVLRLRRSVDRKTFLLPLPLALSGVCLPAMDRRAGRSRDTGCRRW